MKVIFFLLCLLVMVGYILPFLTNYNPARTTTTEAFIPLLVCLAIFAILGFGPFLFLVALGVFARLLLNPKKEEVV